MNESTHSKVKERAAHCHMVISLIHLSHVFHSLPYLCLYALFTRTKQGGTTAGCEVCMCAEESGVHMMNEIVRKQ